MSHTYDDDDDDDDYEHFFMSHTYDDDDDDEHFSLAIHKMMMRSIFS